MFITVAELRTTAMAMIGMELEIIGGGREPENLGENPRPGPGVCNTPSHTKKIWIQLVSNRTVVAQRRARDNKSEC